MPKQGNYSPAAADQLQPADQQSARLAQQQQQQESASTATAAATAQQLLLLKLPPILCGAVHLPQRHVSDIISGKAVPGVQLIVLLSADSAALAVCRAGTIVRHKTMTGGQWPPAYRQAAVYSGSLHSSRARGEMLAVQVTL